MFHICFIYAGVLGPPIPRLLVIFFKVFFFNLTDRPTQYQETHSTLNGKKKGDGHNLKLHKRKHSDFTDFTVLSVWKILLSLTTKKQVP